MGTVSRYWLQIAIGIVSVVVTVLVGVFFHRRTARQLASAIQERQIRAREIAQSVLEQHVIRDSIPAVQILEAIVRAAGRKCGLGDKFYYPRDELFEDVALSIQRRGDLDPKERSRLASKLVSLIQGESQLYKRIPVVRALEEARLAIDQKDLAAVSDLLNSAEKAARDIASRSEHELSFLQYATVLREVMQLLIAVFSILAAVLYAVAASLEPGPAKIALIGAGGFASVVMIGILILLIPATIHTHPRIRAREAGDQIQTDQGEHDQSA